ncbi:MAG TPA: 30S ribosomal protein S12 methylthiotransferase RimO [Phycisphaerales bacterium]|nr:30S ribosomal protein S12 methylthiotransferase RimO [Phycisphaerales bacterium]
MRTKPPLTVCLVSLGCPKNLVDSEKMLAALAEAGCVVGAPMDQADVVVVNTCGFLSAARTESLGVIAEAVACKKRGRIRRVVVAGCLASRDAEKLYRMVPGIDAVVGVDNRGDIVQAVTGKGRKTRLDGKPLSYAARPVRGVSCDSGDAGRFRLTPRHTAYLRIAEGCSQKCTFCTIPAIRGPLRSKPPAMVLNEARELIADGAVELNVIGQDTTSYGRDLGGASLSRLLRALNRLDGARWIRLMYAYPLRFTDAVIGAMADSERVVKYVDLPIQHVSNRVLRRMGRRVGRRSTEQLLEKLRRRIPGVTIRTTFIVGLPGERERDFAELLAFVKDFRFDALGVFEFSPEEGTPAVRLDEPVPPDVSRMRAEQVMLAQQEIAFAANRRRIGRRITVLVDGTDAQGRCVARHAGQAPDIDSVCYLRSPHPAGSFVRARITDCEGYDLIADCGVRNAD